MPVYMFFTNYFLCRNFKKYTYFTTRNDLHTNTRYMTNAADKWTIDIQHTDHMILPQ